MEQFYHPKSSLLPHRSSWSPVTTQPQATVGCLLLLGFPFPQSFPNGISLFKSGIVHLVWGFEIQPRCCVSSYLVPRYGDTTSCLSIHKSVDIWVVSRFWNLHVKLLWTICIHFCAHRFLFLFGKYLRSGNAGACGKCLVNFMRYCQTIFRKG